MKRLVAATLAFLTALLPSTAHAGSGPPCGNRVGDGCGGVVADQVKGDFHGLIMVAGQPGVLATAAHSGSQPGCGDCTWTLIIACAFDSPGDPHNQVACTGAGQGPQCLRGQTAYRLFLSTDDVQNVLVDTLCLGGPGDVIPVGDIAATDVDRYLKDVVPPKLRISVQPPNGVLSNLLAYFQAAPPGNLRPQPFGGPQVTETITITPAHYTWDWGDGTAALHTDDPGGTYPDGQVTHTYDRAGHLVAHLTTEWSATYTITVAGQTFGPYDAVGTVQHTQPLPLVIDRARSHLVSH